jgi:uncharacterized repeat protein (TIGR01451 family)
MSGYERPRRAFARVVCTARLHVFLVAVALVLFGTGVSPALADHLPVNSDPDITAPSLESFAITPTSVDVTDGISKTITATAHITDDKSGVDLVTVRYGSPSGSSSVLFFFGPSNRTSGTSHVGDYATGATIDVNSESGIWRVLSVSARDVVGNERGYTAAEALALGAVDFTVLSNRDATPPQVTAVRVSPSPLDVSSANGFASFEWDATDEGGSGVSAATITLFSPSNRQVMQGQGFDFRTGLSAVTLRGDATTRTFTPRAGFSERGLSQYSEPGVWTVAFVQVYDKANNVTTYQGAALAAILGPSPFFQVISDPTDVAEPAITAFRFSPSSIDVSTAPANVTVQFDVGDELSGVQAAWLTFRSPSIATASPPFLQRTATFYEDMTAPRITAPTTVSGEVTFPRYDRGGDWTVTEVCVMDRVKHTRCYTGDALRVLGPTEITVISNSLTLTPTADENPVGSQHTVTATLASQTSPISGATILFSVTGANSVSGTGTTNSGGQATFTYTGTSAGGDTITACHDGNTNGVCEAAELKAAATKAWVTATNAPPSVDAGAGVSGDEGSAVALDGTVSDADVGDTVTTGWTYTAGVGVDAGATCSFGSAASVDTTITCTDDGTYTLTLTANDGVNAAVADTVTLTVANVAPTVTSLAPSSNEVMVGQSVTWTATKTDPGANDTHTYSFDGGATYGASAAKTVQYTTCGTFTQSVIAKDDDNGTSAVFTSTATVRINCPPSVNADLQIAKTGPANAVVGGQISYTLTVKNNGPANATNVVVTDSVPAGTTFVSSTPSQGTCDATVSCNLGSLASGGSATVTIVVTATAAGTVTNTGKVTATQPDPNATNNSASATTNVYGFAPGGGSFVVGDKTATGAVTFWGAQWSTRNVLSGGAAPAAFKGFALKPATPRCGTGWSTDPGNSAPPPAGPLPAYMAVIVTSTVTKSGSQISGNTVHIVIVKTNPGYDANPGHAGTGTVVATIC